MDKLKETLGPVYKHGFWVACGVIVVLALGMWFMSTLGLQKTTKTNADAIHAAFSTAAGVNSAGVDASGQENDPTQVRFHPNDVSAKETERLIEMLKAEVANAWYRQYSHQRDLFVWPAKLAKRNGADTPFQKAIDKKLQAPRWKFDLEDEQIIVDVQSKEDAIDQVASERGIDPAELEKNGEYVPYLLPIEVAVPFPTPVNEEISDSFRRIYRDFIKGHVPTLVDKIGANWDPSAQATTASRGGTTQDGTMAPTTTGGDDGSDTEENEHIVTWNGQNQAHWLEKLSAFADRAEQDYVPTTLQMLYTQEDLWVLEALLDVIEETNGEVSLKHEAAIKEIDFLLTGKAAGEMPGNIAQVGSSTAGSSEASSPYGQDDASGGGLGADSMGTEGGGYGTEAYAQDGGIDSYSAEGEQEGGPPQLDPANDRYVDRDYKMIPGSKLRDVFAQEPTAEEAYLRVAKRIPVRMGLQMDARKLAKLLAACSNSPLIIEVRQVRMNRHDAKDGASGTTGAGAGGGSGGGRQVGGSSGSIYDGGGDAANVADGGQDNARSTTTTAESHDVPVEIYGVVLIYNPVDAKTLDVKPGKSDEESADDEDEGSDAVPDSAA